MRRRLFILFVPVCELGLGAVAIFSLKGYREPEYKGRKLSEWIQDYAFVMDDGHRETEAIYHIGTNALPWLIKWTLYEEPTWKTCTKRVLPRSLWDTLNSFDRMPSRAIAVRAFSALGDAARPAIGPLAAAVDSSRRGLWAKQAAVEALSRIGNEAIPALLRIISANQQQEAPVTRDRKST